MAKMTVDFCNTGEFSLMASQTPAVLKRAVKAGADLLKVYTANQGRSMLHGPYWTGATVGGLTVKSAGQSGDGYAATVTYAGTNRKGNRHGEVAFLNEYGARGKAARPFNRTAAENNEDGAVSK